MSGCLTGALIPVDGGRAGQFLVVPLDDIAFDPVAPAHAIDEHGSTVDELVPDHAASHGA
ncbi:MAG TPA: hypothetical protein VJT49_15330 [Amycolatopsis sp.]|uniref:hypothetical protein n=1 Tax=Amycolatopsis sp. TaxID=37632 RepID=UPI002B470F61|nr:hypothetical protein [Amycolatopsis sp.]HKS46451.1 hypothetical protein [Amycolatopsis sp.]